MKSDNWRWFESHLWIQFSWILIAFLSIHTDRIQIESRTCNVSFAIRNQLTKLCLILETAQSISSHFAEQMCIMYICLFILWGTSCLLSLSFHSLDIRCCCCFGCIWVAEPRLSREIMLYAFTHDGFLVVEMKNITICRWYSCLLIAFIQNEIGV